MELDFHLNTEQERIELVNKILAETPPEKQTQKYLNILSNYILDAMPDEVKKQRTILTDNRMVTVNKHETSYQGLASKFETGEDGIYNLITNDKNIILSPKDPITKEEKEAIPPLKDLCESIEKLEEAYKKSSGRRKFLLKQQLIQMHQDKYIIRNEYRNPVTPLVISSKSLDKIDLGESITFDADGEPVSDNPITLFNEEGVRGILSVYENLKIESEGKFWKDSYYLIQTLDDLIEKSLKNKFPILYEIFNCKINKVSNAEIQKILFDKFQLTYSIEYISSLWCQKIPKIISEQQKEDYINWYYTSGPGKMKAKWKTCSRCGKTKLAINRFFSKNNTSKDGFYSICKECRNKKKEVKK